MRINASICVLLAGAALIAVSAGKASNPDEALVREAVLDYVEACYNVQPERIEKSVDPNLVKLGFFRGKTTPPTGRAKR